MKLFGIYIANFSKNFQNNVILSVSEVSKQKGFFLVKALRMTDF